MWVLKPTAITAIAVLIALCLWLAMSPGWFGFGERSVSENPIPEESAEAATAPSLGGREEPAKAAETESSPITGGVVVQVRSDGEEPVPGAEVTLYEGGRDGPWGRVVGGPELTDAQGEATFLNLRVTDVTSVVRASGAALSHRRYGRPADPPDLHEHTLRLPEALEAVVVDALSKKPVPSATVTALVGEFFGMHTDNRGHIFGERSQALTDAEGRFRLPDMTGMLRVSAEGYATAWKQVTAREHLDATAFRIYLVPGGILHGVVHSPDGRPLQGARVIASNLAIGSLQTDEKTVYMRDTFRGHWTWGVSRMFASGDEEGPEPNLWCVEDIYPGRVVTTDVQGRWQFDGLAHGSRFLVWATHSMHVSSSYQILTVAPRAVVARLDLNPPTSIKVEVVRPDGKPVPEAHIDMTVEGVRRQARGKGDGVQIPDVVPGTYAVDVSAPWHGAKRNLTWEVKSGDALEKRIVIDLYDDPAKSAEIVLTGRVVAEDGKPIEGASLRLTETGISTLSDADGRFRLKHKRGEFPEIEVEAEGHRPLKKHDWDWNGGKAVELRLDWLRRYIVALPGRPKGVTRGVVVHEKFAGDGSERFVQDYISLTDRTIVDFRAGDKRALLHVEGLLPVFLEAAPKPREVVQAQSVTTTGIYVPIRVEASGRPVRGAEIRAWIDWSPIPVEVETDEAGEAEIGPFLLNRDVTIDVAASGHGVWRVTRRLAKNERLDVHLPAPGVLAGQVLDALGYPVPEVVIRAYRQLPGSEEYEARTRTDNAGRYRLVLLGGKYHLKIGEERSAVSHRLRVEPGTHVSRNFEVKRPR